MSEDEILYRIMNNLEAIDVETKLDSEALINAICGMYLNQGKCLLYITHSDNFGWLYFFDGYLVAAYTEGSTDNQALKDILSWNQVLIKEYRNVDITEEHFSIEMNDFLLLLGGNKNKSLDSQAELKALGYFEGFQCFINDEKVIDESGGEMVFPTSYFKGLNDLGLEQIGLMLKAEFNGQAFSYYALQIKEKNWLFKLKNQFAHFNYLEKINTETLGLLKDG